MYAINPTPESFRALLTAVPAGRPVTMLNLLRFRAQADYPQDSAEPARSGREAYAAYSRAVTPLLQAAGASVRWHGSAHVGVIAPPDEHWDEVLLVEYPSVQAFMAMVKSEAYQAIVFHRTAAILDSRLIATTVDA
jgi:uncharacterized protein (DUF1330 family)